MNRCYQALLDSGFQGQYSAEALPRAFKGAIRRDALQAEGPPVVRPPLARTQAEAVQVEIQALEEELVIPVQPADALGEGQELGEQLSICTRMWIERCRGHDRDDIPAGDLGDRWLQLLFTYDACFEPWTEMVFLNWGQFILPELIETTLDGCLEYVIEEAFYDLYKVLPRTECLDRIEFLKKKQERLLAVDAAPRRPHRPVRVGTANPVERRRTVQQVPSCYETQSEWLAAIRKMDWQILPDDRPMPLYQTVRGRAHFLIVHLFSGRRRHDDVHCHLAHWARVKNVDITVLSMDTAVSVTYGNLSWQPASWKQVVRCYERGWVAATLAGTPCKTFSEARFQDLPLDPAMPNHRRLPRPLRSFERLLGLPALTRREIEQLGAGSMFFLQGLLLLSYHIVGGGCFISEHPAPPRDPARPSIWTSPWLQVPRQHPDLKLHITPQWPFGASVPKPTGLLALRLPSFMRSLYRHAEPSAVRPTAVAIGRNADGSFRTSAHKEYPPKFCAGLAQAITDFLDHNLRTGRAATVPPEEVDFELHRWVQEAKEACSDIRQGAVWLPDSSVCRPLSSVFVNY